MRTRLLLGRWTVGALAIVGSSMPASAQTKTRSVAIDLVGGINVASMTFPVIPLDFADFDVDVSTGKRIGLVAGVLVGVPARDGIAFETGALVSFKGSTVDVTVAGFGTLGSHVSVAYLDVPAVGRFRVAKMSRGGASLLGGVTVGLKLSARQEASFMGETMSMTITDEVSTIDLGATIGGRVEIGRGLVDGRYTWGLLNVATESGPTGETIKNRVFSVMGGWRF